MTARDLPSTTFHRGLAAQCIVPRPSNAMVKRGTNRARVNRGAEAARLPGRQRPEQSGVEHEPVTRQQ